MQASSSATKPTAGEKTPAAPPPVTVPVDAGTTHTAYDPQGSASQPGQVKPALAGQSSVSEAAQSASGLHVQPALSQVQGWMVQIAAVSHAEDAEVLVNALKKRGYSVTVRRDVADNLLHVQTGPFVTRNEANAMRQKLLNDGYNAIVQP
jgi:cell division septation protein DedD